MPPLASSSRSVARNQPSASLAAVGAKVLVAPSGLLRNDATFEDQVREYNERRAQLNKHRELIEKLRRDREASRSPQRPEGPPHVECATTQQSPSRSPLDYARRDQHSTSSRVHVHGSSPNASSRPVASSSFVTSAQEDADVRNTAILSTHKALADRPPKVHHSDGGNSEGVPVATGVAANPQAEVVGEESHGVSGRSSEGWITASITRSLNDGIEAAGDEPAAANPDSQNLGSLRRLSSSIPFVAPEGAGNVFVVGQNREPSASHETSSSSESKGSIIVEEIFAEEETDRNLQTTEKSRVVPTLPLLPLGGTLGPQQEGRSLAPNHESEILPVAQAERESGLPPTSELDGLVNSRPPTAPTSARGPTGVRRHLFVLHRPWVDGIRTTTPRESTEYRCEKAKAYIYALFMTHLTSKGLLKKDPFDSDEGEDGEDHLVQNEGQ